jgi:predicted transcriptional regulator YdeE
MIRFIVILTLLIVPAHADEERAQRPLKIEDEGSFYVAGYAVRTNNAKEASGHGEIGRLWSEFAQRHLDAAISHRVDNRLIVVYSDYASDEKGDYEYLLGAKVSSIAELPRGASYRQVAAGAYAVFRTRAGPAWRVVPDEWRRIWSMPPAELGGRRAFATDYEVYEGQSVDREDRPVEIHVGLKRARR